MSTFHCQIFASLVLGVGASAARAPADARAGLPGQGVIPFKAPAQNSAQQSSAVDAARN